MFYKVTKNNQVIDILDNIKYVKYQKKHDILVLCPIGEAQAILSSDGLYGWHIEGLYNLPTDLSTYVIEEITKYEYDLLKTKKEYEEVRRQMKG